MRLNDQLKTDASFAVPTVKCLQWTLWASAVRRRGGVRLNGCLKPCRRTDGQIIFTSGRRAVPHVNPPSCRMAQILCPDAPQPWPEAFSLRVGGRAEERGLAIDWFSSLALASYPTLQEAREQPLIEGPRWSFFHFPGDFLNELLSVSRTHYFLLFFFSLTSRGEINAWIRFDSRGSDDMLRCWVGPWWALEDSWRFLFSYTHQELKDEAKQDDVPALEIQNISDA